MSVETMTVGAIGFVEKESRMIRNVLSLASNNEYTYQMVIGDQKSANLMIINADDPAAMAVWNECFKIDPNRAVIFASTNCQFEADHACIKRPLIASQLHGVLSLEGTRTGATASIPQKYQLLRKSFLFRNLSFSHLEKIVALSRPVSLPAEHVVFEMADVGAEMCVILKGRLKVSVTNGEGREIVLGTVGPGEIIGEIAMLDGRGRSASAVTLTACDLLMIHREDFMPFLEQNPKAAIDLINVLALRLRLNTGQLAEFVIKEATPSPS